MSNDLKTNDQDEVKDENVGEAWYDHHNKRMDEVRIKSLRNQMENLKTLGYSEGAIKRIFSLNNIPYEEPAPPIDLRQETAETLEPRNFASTVGVNVQLADPEKIVKFQEELNLAILNLETQPAHEAGEEIEESEPLILDSAVDGVMREDIRQMQLQQLGEVPPPPPNFEAFGAVGKQLAESFTEVVNKVINFIGSMNMDLDPGRYEDEHLWTDEEVERQEQFAKVCLEAEKLFMTKNREYGNSIKYTGAVGSLVAMTGDMGKLRHILLHRLDELDLVDLANVRDKFIDVLVQAVIGIMMLDNDNIMGEE